MTKYKQVSSALGAMRGFSIVWITAFHLIIGTKKNISIHTLFSEDLVDLGTRHLIEKLLETLILIGDSGVTLFIFISGFGLTASWLKKVSTNQDPLNRPTIFLRKRFSKIFPPFYLAIVLTSLIYFINPEWIPSGKEIWSEGIGSILLAFFATVTTLRNFIPVHEYYYFMNGAWWYIGLACQLYLVFPLCIQIGKRKGWDNLLLWSFLLSFSYLSIISLSASGFLRFVLINLCPAHLFEFCLGIYIANHLNKDFTTLKNQGWQSLLSRFSETLCTWKFAIFDLMLFVLGVAFRILSGFSSDFLSVLSHFLILIGLIRILLCLLTLKTPIINLVLNTIGRFSYGIYLTHMSFYLLLWSVGINAFSSYWLRFGFVVFSCCLIGAIFEIFFSSIQRWHTSLTSR